MRVLGLFKGVQLDRGRGAADLGSVAGCAGTLFYPKKTLACRGAADQEIATVPARAPGSARLNRSS
jgi:hypothetical protein